LDVKFCCPLSSVAVATIAAAPLRRLLLPIAVIHWCLLLPTGA
jgi:hypothetical protein